MDSEAESILWLASWARKEGRRSHLSPNWSGAPQAVSRPRLTLPILPVFWRRGKPEPGFWWEGTFSGHDLPAPPLHIYPPQLWFLDLKAQACPELVFPRDWRASGSSSLMLEPRPFLLFELLWFWLNDGLRSPLWACVCTLHLSSVHLLVCPPFICSINTFQHFYARGSLSVPDSWET